MRLFSDHFRDHFFKVKFPVLSLEQFLEPFSLRLFFLNSIKLIL